MMNSELSTYTISIYELIDANFDFGLDKYEIFDENYRATLNKSILDYYMFREIGYVNPAVFKQRLQNRMDIIMRNKYNALYKAKQLDFNPLYTMELYEDYSHSVANTGVNSNTGVINYNTQSTTNTTNNETTNTTNKDDSETDSNTLQLSSQFPSEEMTEDDISSNLYVDNASKTKGTQTVTDKSELDSTLNGNIDTSISGTDETKNTTNGTTTNNMTETFSKKTIGSASDLTFAHAMTQFKEYCDSFNLDQLVINELKDLFMQCW